MTPKFDKSDEYIQSTTINMLVIGDIDEDITKFISNLH